MKRIVATLLVGLLVAPSAVLAQSKAGVVTTLEGNVTARRVALPDPVPLKFKDDVLLQDTVSTGDKSLARMLLGGKAVVTVRERSVLTITEVPGRSTIELETGKFALAVAREKMRPGEEIQIRTPNAIAGVRGTVVITEVSRQTAQLGRAAASVLTKFYVLRGDITAQPLDISTRQPLGTPLNVGPMHAYSGVGSATPRVTPVPPDEVTAITSGLQPSGLKGGSDAGQEQVKVQAMETATALLGALTGTAGATQLAAIVGSAPTMLTVGAPTETPIIVPLTPVTGESAFASAFLTRPQIFDGVFTSTSPDALLQLKNATIFQAGEDVDFVQVKSGGNVSLAGPLATFVDSLLLTTGSLFDLTGGSLTSTSPAALFALDPTFVLTTDALITMTGGILTLAGPLLTDVSGLLSIGAEILRMEAGAALVSTSPDALLQLSGSIVSSSGALSMTSSTLTLGGSLVSFTDTLFASPNGDRSFIDLAEGSRIIASGTNAPLLTFIGGTLSLAGPLFTDVNGVVSVAAEMLRMQGGADLDSASPAALVQLNGTTLTAGLDVFSLSNGASLSSTSTQPLITLTNSSLETGGRFVRMRAAGGGGAVGPSSMTLAGPLLSSLSSTVTTLRDVLSVTNSSFTSTTPFPLVQVTGGTLSAGGFDPIANATTTSRLLLVSSSALGAATLQLAGPLLAATNTTVTVNGGVIGAFNGSTLSSTTANALIALDNAQLTNGSPVNNGQGAVLGTFGVSGETVNVINLNGALLSASNGSALTLASNIIDLFEGTRLTSTTTDALVTLSGGSHSFGTRALMHLAGRQSAATGTFAYEIDFSESTESFELTGLGTDPMLSTGGIVLDVNGAVVTSTEGSVTVDTALLAASAPLLNLRGGANVTLGDGVFDKHGIDLVKQARLDVIGPLVKLDNSTLTLLQGHAVNVAGGSLLNVTGNLIALSNGSTLTLNNGALLNVAGNSVASISGALVSFSGLGNIVNVTNILCGSCFVQNGVTVALLGGAVASQVSIGPGAIPGAGINLSASGAHVAVSGTASKVTIAPAP